MRAKNLSDFPLRIKNIPKSKAFARLKTEGKCKFASALLIAQAVGNKLEIEHI
tara:strand:+ start:16238 stop:16396 length:159 start_codon:yes stop_codon:yes gene_type:complete